MLRLYDKVFEYIEDFCQRGNTVTYKQIVERFGSKYATEMIDESIIALFDEYRIFEPTIGCFAIMKDSILEPSQKKGEVAPNGVGTYDEFGGL